ncbi:MAG: hypothetical protein WAY02_07355 [Burkholderiaceae bacterium]
MPISDELQGQLAELKAQRNFAMDELANAAGILRRYQAVYHWTDAQIVAALGGALTDQLDLVSTDVPRLLKGK